MPADSDNGQAAAHLLVVDDDERIRTLLTKFLARNGFIVSAARDAAHARRLIEGLVFDLLIVDVMMPGEDGFSLTRALRDQVETPVLLLAAIFFWRRRLRLSCEFPERLTVDSGFLGSYR